MKKYLISMLLGVLSLNIALSQSPDRRLREITAEKFPAAGVYIGATTHYTAVDPLTTLGRILAEEFSYITPANDFKQSYIHPEPGKWKWEYPDGWLQFAVENKQVVRMHGPISPQCSSWAREDSRTGEELEQNLEEFMTALCQRYNGHPNVIWMDVINETVNPDGSWKKDKPGIAWEIPWVKTGYETLDPETATSYPALGASIPNYIIQAFEIATEHAPDIKLVINQHAGMEDAMWNKVKDMVLFLRSRGLRVDGIGWQAHIKPDIDEQNNWETDRVDLEYLAGLIDWAHANDLGFHVTENNIHVLPEYEGHVKEHALIFEGIVKTVLDKAGSGEVSWNLWDLKDVDHYANNGKVKIGLWDRQNQPKESYYRVQALLEKVLSLQLAYRSASYPDQVKLRFSGALETNVSRDGFELTIDGEVQAIDSAWLQPGSPSWMVLELGAELPSGDHDIRISYKGTQIPVFNIDGFEVLEDPGNMLPSVEISSPLDSSTIEEGSAGAINILATDSDGTILSLELLINGSSVHSFGSEPYTFPIDTFSTGSYQVIAIARDDRLDMATDTIVFSVAVNQPPLVDISVEADSNIFNPGQAVPLRIRSSDPEGKVSRIEVFINEMLVLRFTDTDLFLTVDTLSLGTHEFIARVKDDHANMSYDTVLVLIEKELSLPGREAIPGTGLRVYPNPVTRVLHISKPTEFRLFDLQGRQVLNGSNVDQVDVSSLPGGLYIFRAGSSSIKVRKVHL